MRTQIDLAAGAQFSWKLSFLLRNFYRRFCSFSSSIVTVRTFRLCISKPCRWTEQPAHHYFCSPVVLIKRESPLPNQSVCEWKVDLPTRIQTQQSREWRWLSRHVSPLRASLHNGSPLYSELEITQRCSELSPPRCPLSAVSHWVHVDVAAAVVQVLSPWQTFLFLPVFLDLFGCFLISSVRHVTCCLSSSWGSFVYSRALYKANCLFKEEEVSLKPVAGLLRGSECFVLNVNTSSRSTLIPRFESTEVKLMVIIFSGLTASNRNFLSSLAQPFYHPALMWFIRV